MAFLIPYLTVNNVAYLATAALAAEILAYTSEEVAIQTSMTVTLAGVVAGVALKGFALFFSTTEVFAAVGACCFLAYAIHKGHPSLESFRNCVVALALYYTGLSIISALGQSFVNVLSSYQLGGFAIGPGGNIMPIFVPVQPQI